MTARPTDWSPLGLAGDPVKGDVEGIRDSAKKLRQVKNDIVTLGTKLNKLNSDEGWDSESGEVFRTASGDLKGAIDKAKGRYDDVATALYTYADELVLVQTSADDILERAKTAISSKSTADGTELPDKEADDYDEKKKAQEDAVDTATGDLKAAKDDIANLIGADGPWQQANNKAAEAIKNAADDELKDSWWDHVKQAIHEIRHILNALKDILNIIGAIIGAALLVLFIISMFIPGINLLVLAVAAVVVAALLVITTALLAISGDGGWDEVGFALLDLGLSIVGLKALSTVGKLAKGTTKLISSVSRSAGNTARANGSGYSQAYQGMKAALEGLSSGKAVQVLDQLALGGLGKLTSVWIIAGKTGSAADKIFINTLLKFGLPAAGGASYGTYDFVNDIATGVGDVTNMIQGDWVDSLYDIRVGAL